MEASDAPKGVPAASVAGTEGREYALALGEAELARYRLMAERARATEADLWERAGIGAGAEVTDVGCGPGALLPALSDAVGPSGRVTAIDADPAAVGLARVLAVGAGLANVTVRQGRAERTELPPASCDVVTLRHVLAHNGGAEDLIVGHLATLLRPGGVLYLVDADGTAMRMVPEDADVTDLHDRYLAFHAARGNDVRAGLRLGERLLRAGLELIAYRGTYIIEPIPAGMRQPPWAARDAMVAAGLATGNDVARWARAFDRLDAAARRPTLFAPMFVALGRRPA